MYQTKKTFVKPESRMSDLIFDNPSLLYLLENFDIDSVLQDKTVADICIQKKINPALFVSIANLYNGFYNIDIKDLEKDDLCIIIRLLKNSHKYYKEEKFPELRSHLNKLYELNDTKEIRLIEQFFNEYYDEVIEHLDYEDKYAFPYFSNLINGCKEEGIPEAFSVEEYRNHHTDIESKLKDLQNLLLKHINIKDDFAIRRKLLINLFELDNDILIHSMIEEIILAPLVHRIEIGQA